MRIAKVDGLRFVVETELEAWRASTLLTKEEGTIDWLRTSCHAGDVFLDVGANIGLYSIFAARLIGPTGRVVAVEPHLASAHALMLNVLQNGMQDRVDLITSALGSQEGWEAFNYNSLATGSSGSQLGHQIAESGQPFTPHFTELKYTTTADEFFHHRPAPSLAKIDVDGNELAILSGMARLLWERRLRSLQVEIHEPTLEGIHAMLEHAGYRLQHRHHTQLGKKDIAAGVDPLTIAHNAIYEPA